MSLSRLSSPPEWGEPPADYDDAPPDYVPRDAAAEVTPLEVLRLGDLMRAGVPAPTMVDDWLYASMLTSLQSEPGVGKSWIALWLAKRQMEAGRSVAYLDEEGGPELVTERLLALGADPAMVDEQCCYLPFPQRKWGAVDLSLLAEVLAGYHARHPLAAGYLDSLPDFLAAAGDDEDRSGDITKFTAKILPVFRHLEAALVVLDHLKKPEKDGKKSRYARGSGAKLAKVAAAILIETEKEFDAKTSGRLRVWKTKDRRGRLPLPGMAHAPLMLDVTVADGTVTIGEGAPAVREAWDGPSECMESVAAVLRQHSPDELSGTQLAGLAANSFGSGFRKETVKDAARRLAERGEAVVRPGPRGSLLYRWAGGVDSVAVALDEDF